jgi:hypothetical protein
VEVPLVICRDDTPAELVPSTQLVIAVVLAVLSVTSKLALEVAYEPLTVPPDALKPAGGPTTVESEPGLKVAVEGETPDQLALIVIVSPEVPVANVAQEFVVPLASLIVVLTEVGVTDAPPAVQVPRDVTVVVTPFCLVVPVGVKGVLNVIVAWVPEQLTVPDADLCAVRAVATPAPTVVTSPSDRTTALAPIMSFLLRFTLPP